MFILLLMWLLIGGAFMTALIATGFKLTSIENKTARRVAIVTVTTLCMPSFIALSAADHFMQWADYEGFSDLTAKQAFKNFLEEIGPGFYAEIKETW